MIFLYFKRLTLRDRVAGDREKWLLLQRANRIVRRLKTIEIRSSVSGLPIFPHAESIVSTGEQNEHELFASAFSSASVCCGRPSWFYDLKSPVSFGKEWRRDGIWRRTRTSMSHALAHCSREYTFERRVFPSEEHFSGNTVS